MGLDLDKRLVFPMQIVTTKLRPDIILWSESPKMVVMVELIVPWEEWMLETTGKEEITGIGRTVSRTRMESMVSSR